MNEDVFAYIAVRECGCASAIHVDRPHLQKEVAKFVGKMIREGLTIERVSLETGKDRLNWEETCPHNKPDLHTYKTSTQELPEVSA